MYRQHSIFSAMLVHRATDEENTQVRQVVASTRYSLHKKKIACMSICDTEPI